MTPNLETKLFEAYPNIFSPAISIECSDGWYDILDAWCSLVTANDKSNFIRHQKNIILHTNDQFVSVRPVQIKEKFGTLRIYTNIHNDFVDGVTSMAEEMSEKTCEVCGHPGIIRGGAWIRVLCDQHFVAQSLGAPSSFMGDDE
jgi:hypothetical protein